jgi:hypothetical protein
MNKNYKQSLKIDPGTQKNKLGMLNVIKHKILNYKKIIAACKLKNDTETRTLF